MKTLLQKFVARPCISTITFCLLLTFFCSTSFAYIVSNTSTSASLPGSFANAIQRINADGFGGNITFDFHGAGGTHYVPMANSVANYAVTIDGLGENVVLQNTFSAHGVSELKNIKSIGNITFYDGGSLDFVNLPHGLIRLGGNGAGNTIELCDFIADSANRPVLSLSTNYTVEASCSFSNAYVILYNECDISDVDWSGNNNKLYLGSDNIVENVSNCDLDVEGNENQITDSAFFNVELTGSSNEFKNNIVVVNSSSDQEFIGNYNIIFSNSFSSLTTPRTLKVSGNYNSFINNNSFSNYHGVDVQGNYNQIKSNIIGLNETGTEAAGNSYEGVRLTGWNNEIGGMDSEDENYISGNGGNGIEIYGGGQNEIYNNFIGLGLNGTDDIGNGQDGIYINNSISNSIGDEALAGNYICNNSRDAISVNDSPFSIIQSNFCGVNYIDEAAGNGGHGIYVDGCDFSTISANVAVDNSDYGIYLYGHFCEVYNNYIGFYSDSSIPGNGSGGIYCISSTNTTIGSDIVEYRNIIANNDGPGITLYGGMNNTVVGGNFIGIIEDNSIYGNTNAGVFLENVSSVTIGDAGGLENIISGNKGTGILILGGGKNIIQNNVIGMNEDGDERLPNFVGISITGSCDNLIGGDNDYLRNYISGNDGNGIEFRSNCTNNFVVNNYIGVDFDGTNNFYNNDHGIYLLGSTGRQTKYNVIKHNVIGFNNGDGIYIGDNATRNIIDGNSIGVNSELAVDIANEYNGISLCDNWNKVGTENGNYIGANKMNGLVLSDCGWSEIYNNYIGVCSTGDLNFAFPNLEDGISIVDEAKYNHIGKTNENYNENYNVITANKGNGIYIGVNCDGNRIENNYIGMTVDDDTSIPFNGESGIYLFDNSDNWIGGLDSGEGNYVVGSTCLSYDTTRGNWNYRNHIGYPSKSTNVLTGIYISSSKYERFGQSGSGNYIGNAKDEAAFIEDSTNITFNHTLVGIDPYGEVVTNLGNGFDFSRCYNCRIENSYIAGSQIGINASYSEGLDIRGNYIGFNSEFYVGDGNRDYGILLSSCSNVYIRYGNYISGNDGHGIEINDSMDSSVSGNKFGLWTNGYTRCENLGDGIRVLYSSNIKIGTDGRNYIAGCSGNGVFIEGGMSNEVALNRIGTAINALTAVTNSGTGVLVVDSFGNDISENVIGGNGGDGICISGSLASANMIDFNYIGIGSDGATVISNKKCGVRIINAPGNFIGDGSFMNVICASGEDGIRIEGVNSSNNIAFHNKIGLDIYINKSGNADNGICIIDAANCTISSNIICASGDCGIKIADSTSVKLAQHNRIENNKIGYYNNFNQSNAFDGVQIYKAAFNYIGPGNVIGRNGRNGINITGFGAQNNSIIGNFIGVTDDEWPISNGGHGVQLSGGDANKVGFTNDWEKNFIAYNASNGVNVALGIYNRILGNSIYNNGEMGINLGPQGRTSGDVTNVPNNYQPYPVLDGAYSGSVTRIVGYLSAKPDANYLLEFFATPNTNEAGYGEGKTFVGRQSVDTAGDGMVNFSVNFNSPVENGYIITATATATNGNSSEFSVPVWVSSSSLSANFAVDKTLVLTGAVVNFTDMSEGIPTTWAWDFDNNGSTDSTTENPQHSYSSVGDKSVKLTVTDSLNSTIVKTNIIRVGGARHLVTNENTNLQNVIDSSKLYDFIELADGTYSLPGRTFNGQNVFVLDNNITIIGNENNENQPVIDGLGTMRCAYVISGRVVGVTFQNGSASGAGASGQGGGAVCGEKGEIFRCKAMNSSATEGGGIFVNYGGVIKSSLIISNNATSGGGVIVANGGAAFNTTIAENDAITSAGGALCAGEMVNNIVYYNTAPTDPNLTISVGTFTYGCTTPAKTGTGNISNVPEFLPNYGIEFSSPCTETATELDWMSWSKDLANEPRLRGNSADMGAYSAVIPEPGFIFLIFNFGFWIYFRKITVL